MQRENYRADYGHFKLPALPGWEEYVPKVKKLSKNKYNQLIEKRKTYENLKTAPIYNPKTTKPA